MNAEGLYSALLYIYPPRFRREYGELMLDAFRQARREHDGDSLLLWRFLLVDLGRSILIAHFDAARTLLPRSVWRWAFACGGAAALTALVANALTRGVGYLYHPYLEGIRLPPFVYGALLGGVLGVTQAAGLGRRHRLGARWIAITSMGAAFGLELAAATVPTAGPLAYGIVLGSVVGAAQWAALRSRVRGAAWWSLGTAAVLSGLVLSGAVAVHTTLQGWNPIALNTPSLGTEGRTVFDFLARGLQGPSSSAELIVELAAMVTCGLVIAAVTARPLFSAHDYQEKR